MKCIIVGNGTSYITILGNGYGRWTKFARRCRAVDETFHAAVKTNLHVLNAIGQICTMAIIKGLYRTIP